MEGIFGIEKVLVKLLVGKRPQVDSSEEFTIGSRRPYIDNRLNPNSVFPRLAAYSSQGYRSCGIFPFYSGGKALGVVTALSIMENRFNSEMANGLLVGTSLFGYYLSGYIEMSKEASLAEYFDAIFDSAVPQMLVDKAWVVVKVNKAFIIASGKGYGEIVGSTLQAELSLSQQAAKHLEIGNADVTVGPDKKRFNAVMKKINQSLSHVLLLDVTQVKQLDLRASALDHMSGSYAMVLDVDTAVTWASQGISSVLGVNAEQLVGLKLSDSVKGWKEIDRLISESERHAWSGTVSIKAGKTVDVPGAKMSITRNESGFVCMVYDEGMEKHSNAMKAQIRRMIDLTGDLVIITDEMGYVSEVNRNAERLLGRAGAELAGKPVAMLCLEGESQISLSRCMSAARKGMQSGVESLQFVGRNADDGIPCDAGVSAVIDQNGRFSGYMIIAREKVTGIQNMILKAEVDKLKKEIDKLKSESELKTQFIYNISHDLKTPITNIMGFSDLLYEGQFGTLNNEQKEYVKIISDESARFTKLIQQILDVAKLSAGKMKLDMQEISFQALGDNPSIKAMEESVRSKGLGFKWIVDHDVPNLSADPSRLIQVFVNLIGNAIKFTENGEVKVRVYRKGRSVRVDVIDTGIGISKDDQRKIFKKFYQVQRKGLTMQEGAGTGLGLSIVKEIVDRHSGKVGIESDPGMGSTFWFTIPIYPAKRRKRSQKQDRTEEAKAELNEAVMRDEEDEQQ